MYAIVEIAGQQFKIEKEQELFVHRLEGDAGSSVEFENVKLLDNDGKVTVGTPDVDGVKIKAKIVEHLRGDKVIVFHKKRRKGYQKQNGHRQYFSKILIEDILTGVKKSAKKEEVNKEEPKKEVKAEVKTEKPKSSPKVEAETKEVPKKVEAPKAEVKKTEEKKETKTEAQPMESPKAKATKEETPKNAKIEDK